MAAANQTQPVRYNVNGSWREQYYTVLSAGASNDTIQVGMNEIVFVDFSPNVTSFSFASNGPGAGSTLTFTGTNATTYYIVVVGH